MNEGYECDSSPPQVYYFFNSEKLCESFVYRGCGGNGNRFKSPFACEDFCVQSGNARPESGASRELIMPSTEHMEYEESSAETLP